MNVLVSLFNSLPGAAGQGLIWGIMAIGVYITYKILDVADLTVDGSLATGGAVAALCVSMGWNPWLAVLAAVVYLLIKMPVTKRYMPMAVCLMMVSSGAVGNMIDRIGQGYVVDFLYFKLINFPIFNVADCYVTIAAFLLILLVFFYYREEEMACFSFRKKEEKPE